MTPGIDEYNQLYGIVREVAESDPMFPDDFQERSECFWCNASCRYGAITPDNPIEEHDEDCLWVRARKAVGMS